MKRYLQAASVLSAAVILFSGIAHAESTDKAKPTELAGNTIQRNISATDTTYFYTKVFEPGTYTLKADIQPQPGATKTMSVSTSLLSPSGKAIAPDVHVKSDHKKAEQTFSISSRQPITIKVAETHGGSGMYKLDFEKKEAAQHPTHH